MTLSDMEEKERKAEAKERPIVLMIVVCLLLGVTYSLVKRAISPRSFEAKVLIELGDSPEHRPSLWETDDLYLEVMEATWPIFPVLSKDEELERFKAMNKIIREDDQIRISFAHKDEETIESIAREFSFAYQRLLSREYDQKLKEEIEALDSAIIEEEDVVFSSRKKLEEALLLAGAPTVDRGLLAQKAFEDFWSGLPENTRASKEELARKVREVRQSHDESLARLTSLKAQKKEASNQLENWKAPKFATSKLEIRKETFWENPIQLISSMVAGSVVFTGIVLLLAYLFLWRSALDKTPSEIARDPDDPADVW